MSKGTKSGPDSRNILAQRAPPEDQSQDMETPFIVQCGGPRELNEKIFDRLLDAGRLNLILWLKA